MKKFVLFLLIIAFLVLLVVFVLDKEGLRNPRNVACTTEALLCPDGGAVGRTGPLCEFSPCPNQESFTGELIQQGEKFRLVIAAPATTIQEVTYSLPIEFSRTSNVLGYLINKQVRVKGNFTIGNILAVDFIEEVSGEGVTSQEIGVGDTKFINGLRITLNNIAEDSRCPINVICIQMGRILANITLKSDTDIETLNLASDAEPKLFDIFKVSITSVSPSAMADKIISPETYKVTLKVEKN